MKSINVITLSIMASSLTFFNSCGGGAEEPKEKTYDYQRSDSLPPEYTRNLGIIRVSIEDANIMNELLKKGGYAYNSSALNSAGKASGYSNAKMQAINLGVYTSDLNYAVAYEQAQDVMNFLKSVMQLSEKMGIAKAFDAAMMEKLTSQDTTADKSLLLTRAYRSAEDQLHSNDRAALVTLMVVGGWVEGLHIATTALKTKPGEGEILMKIFEHVQTYQNMVAMLNVFKGNSPDCAEILKEVLTIENTVKDIIYTKGNISPAMLEVLDNSIAGLRNKLV